MMVGNAIEHGGWTNATFVGYRFSETDRRVARADDMGHSTKSLRDSPLRGEQEPLTR